MVVRGYWKWMNDTDVIGSTRRYGSGIGKQRSLCMCIIAMTIDAPHGVHNAINFVHIL